MSQAKVLAGICYMIGHDFTLAMILLMQNALKVNLLLIIPFNAGLTEVLAMPLE
jgi:hypothetical protein